MSTQRENKDVAKIFDYIKLSFGWNKTEHLKQILTLLYVGISQ